MYALKFKFKNSADSLSLEVFGALLNDFMASRTNSPIVRTQVFYPDNSELGDIPPNEFMIELDGEDALDSLRQFLQRRSDVRPASVLAWEPSEAMAPQRPGMWCHSYHASQLRLSEFSEDMPLPC